MTHRHFIDTADGQLLRLVPVLEEPEDVYAYNVLSYNLSTDTFYSSAGIAISWSLGMFVADTGLGELKVYEFGG